MRYISAASFINLIFIAGLGLFIAYRNSPVISQRVPRLLYVNAFCCILYTNFQLLLLPAFKHLYVWVPCFLQAWVSFLVIPTWLACYTLRAIYIVANDHLNKVMLRVSQQTFNTAELPVDIRVILTIRKWIKRLRASKKRIPSFGMAKSCKTGDAEREDTDQATTKDEEKNTEDVCSRTDEDNKITIVQSRHLPGSKKELQADKEALVKQQTHRIGRVTEHVLYYILGAVFVASWFLLALVHVTTQGLSVTSNTLPVMLVKEDLSKVSPKPQFDDEADFWKWQPSLVCLSGCSTVYNSIFPLIITLYVLFLLTMPYFVYTMRHVKDSFFMRQEMMMYMGAQVPLLLLHILLSSAIRILEEKAETERKQWREGTVSNDMPPTMKLMQNLDTVVYSIPIIFGVWSFFVSIIIPAVIAMHRTHSASRNAPSTQDCSHFDTILLNKKPFKLFKASLATQLCLENGLFAEDFLHLVKVCLPQTTIVSPAVLKEKLEEHFGKQTQGEVSAKMRKAVLKLYEMYIEAASPHELNLLGSTRNEIKASLEANKFHPVVFCKAWKEVYTLMMENTYKEFVKGSR
jgi:hypothetical protein